jgi:hypothetical protein
LHSGKFLFDAGVFPKPNTERRRYFWRQRPVVENVVKLCKVANQQILVRRNRTGKEY